MDDIPPANNFDNFPLIVRKISSKIRRSKRHQCIKRVINRRGDLNLQPRNLPFKYLKFTKDFANTLVSLRWRWVTLIVVLINVFFYIVCAGIWMLDSYISGDANGHNTTEEFCIIQTHFDVYTFVDFLLLSIETITTTGYGHIYPTENCTLVWFTMLLSTVVMILIDGAFISVVFLKICKPLKKDALMIFSKKAVICLRNGKLSFVIKVNDPYNKHTINPKLSVFVIDKKAKDKIYRFFVEEIETKPVGMLLWPTEIVHEINSESPFWELTAAEMMKSRLEIAVTLSGSSLVTGQFSTSQTSYLSEEIYWGYNFELCMEFKKKIQKHIIHKDRVFKITPCNTPLCSAEQLALIKTLGLN